MKTLSTHLKLPIILVLALLLLGGQVAQAQRPQRLPVPESLPAALAAATVFDCSPANQIEIPQAECEALVALYNSTDGPNWTDSPANNWTVTTSPCSWTGVNCTAGQVTSLNRSSQGLSGSIPDLSALTSLQYL